METILLTGTTGFVGKRLLERVKAEKKYDIHVLERYVTGRYSQVQPDGVTVHHANLQDYDEVHNIVAAVNPNYVIHLGALSAVSYSYNNYLEVSEVNYIGTLNLAEACRRHTPNFKQFIFAGTSEEYGQAMDYGYTMLSETTPMYPNSPYSVAKFAAEHYLKYMGMAYAFPYTIMHPFNTYGRTENTHFFIERTITQMLNGGPVRLGDPEARRDWLYIDDHVQGYMSALGNREAIGGTFNLCTGESYTTKETAETIAELTGYKGEIEWNTIPRRPLDAHELRGDNANARLNLLWVPKYNLREGLAKTIDALKGARA